MYRTHTCGQLRSSDTGTKVTLAGWVQKVRNLGAMTFIDLRDRYGITQLALDENSDPTVHETANKLGREFVIQVSGTVIERASKNNKIPTGEIEIAIETINILNAADTPPFTIEENSDGGDDLRMKYRFLDLRRPPLQRAMALRHSIAQETRRYLSDNGFMEIETPYMIKSTPEGARDFVVPSRMNKGEFYALPQSPQTFKQLLMVSGYDKYFQIVRCFRDEDLRADRQPEFTQIDCEMAFVEQEDVLNMFEGYARHIFKNTIGVELDTVPRMPYAEAMEKYGSDKPDIRFGMTFNDITKDMQGVGFSVFDNSEYIGAIVAPDCAGYTRKQVDELTNFVKRPQVGATGLVYIRCEAGGGFKSSVDKFYTAEMQAKIAEKCEAKAGDLILILAGGKKKTLAALSTLRLEMGTRLGLRDKNVFAPLWVVDFPLVEWDDETQRFYAMHHPFTSPKPEDIHLLGTATGEVRANAYDFVMNGVELGGGSIRIHDAKLQSQMFEVLGFTPEEAYYQFGFLLDAFKFGAPPHGGLAFGFDRLCSMFGGSDSIRDYIAFPKNNSGRDVMADAPSFISEDQLEELMIELKTKEIVEPKSEEN